MDGSILCGCLTSPEIAPTGHTFLHIPQPLHFSGLISIFAKALHSSALHS